MTTFQWCNQYESKAKIYVEIICGELSRFTTQEDVLNNPNDPLYSVKARGIKQRWNWEGDHGKGTWRITFRLVDCPKNRAAFDF